MNFWPAYLGQRLVFRVGDFFARWYYHGSRRFGFVYMGLLARLDRIFAVQVTLKHFFEPLYKDYSVVGRILGPIFRSGRVLIGGVIYALTSVVFLTVYLAWLAIPPLLILLAVRGVPPSAIERQLSARWQSVTMPSVSLPPVPQGAGDFLKLFKGKSRP